MIFLSLFSGDLLQALAGLIAYLSVLFIVMPTHEFAHSWAAKKEGDYTAYYLKRYTLAPLAHIDLKGFLCLLIFGFGWAKPVPVDPRNFKRGRKSEVRVALAGIITNLIEGVVFTGLLVAFLTFVPYTPSNFLYVMYYLFFSYGALVSLAMAFFNLLPVYPLDGFRVVEALTKPGNKYVEFVKHNTLFMYILVYVFASIYFNFTLYPMFDGLRWVWSKFFSLFV